MRHTMKTVGGYESDEVTSAMQKEIRRGNEEDALHWATELDLSGSGEYAWERLLIIASEDVGHANNRIVHPLHNLWHQWREGKNEKFRHGRRLFLVHAVMLLARAEKSRQVDHATVVFYKGKRATAATKPIPDYALDGRHTERGKAMGRDAQFFFDVAAKLEREGFNDDPYEDRAREIQGAKPKPALNLEEAAEAGDSR